MKIPIDKEKFAKMVLDQSLVGLRLDQVVRGRDKLESEKQFDVISSDEFEMLMSQPNYIRSDDPLCAILGIMNLKTNEEDNAN